MALPALGARAGADLSGQPVCIIVPFPPGGLVDTFANHSRKNAQRALPSSRRPTMAISLKVNGATRSVDAEPDTPLLYVLRNDLELNGAKYGCGLTQCGACTVLVNGAARRSCVTPVGSIEGNEVTTLEGLGTPAACRPTARSMPGCASMPTAASPCSPARSSSDRAS